MAIPTVIVAYDGTDYGRVYLRDVGQRNQLGGGQGLYTLGQDRYLSHGEDATLIGTGDVYMSATSGVIKDHQDRGAFTVTD